LQCEHSGCKYDIKEDEISSFVKAYKALMMTE
jgi:hypothetical protein